MSKLSVIVPVYNVEAYLRECVDSILRQSFSDFELLLIDDGSTDRSGEICEEYAGRDARVRVFHQPNAGQAAARNRGVREAKTDLICFIDSDDAVNPSILALFLQAFRAHGVGAAVSDRICGAAPPADFYAPIQTEPEILQIDEAQLLRLFRNNSTIYWTLFPCLLKKSVFEKYPLTPGRVMEDNAVACKWLAEAETVAVLHAPLYFYRENPAGTMREAFGPRKLDYLWALEEQLAFYKACGCRTMQGEAAKHYVESALWLAKRCRNELNDPKLARDTVRKAVRIRKRYADAERFPAELDRKLRQAAHPYLHRIRKKLRGA